MAEDTINKPKTLKNHLRALGLAALMVLSPIVGVELLLQVFDPWGVSYFDDMRSFGAALNDDALRGYVLPDGVYQFSNWTTTMENGSRYIPNTNPNADCQIVAIGDSLTFAYGVDDDKGWINYIAAEFPQVHFINAAMTAYNSANVLGSWQAFPDADAYFYFSPANDWEPAHYPSEIVQRNNVASLPFLMRYIQFFSQRRATETSQEPRSAEELLANPDLQRYFDDMQRLNQISNLNIVILEQNFLRPALDELGIRYRTMPGFSGYALSVVDGHYNNEGNQRLAANLRPIFAEIIDSACS